MKPEQQARQQIDRQLELCGWDVQDYRQMNISASQGVAVREFPLTTGDADYMLYVEGKVYDLRTNIHCTLKQNPLVRGDLDDFVGCYKPGDRQKRRQTWSEKNPEGRWRAFDYEELIKRDKVNLDLFWLKDKSLEDSDDLPDPDVLADEIADDLQTALDQLRSIAEGLRE